MFNNKYGTCKGDVQVQSSGSVQTTDVEHVEWEQPLDIYNECIGEWISGNVSIKVVGTTKTKSDGTTQYRTTYNVSGVLYDEAGNKYIWRDNTFFHDQDTQGGCPYVSSGVGVIRLLTPGGKNNMNLNIDFHYTFDCEGNFNVDYDNFSVTCK